MSSRKTKEEYLAEKALEEARKAGTAEPEKDEEGKDINPHIPEYIAKAPWYLNKGVPSLKHQRKENDREQNHGFEYYKRGIRAGPAVTKYRKGACANCGAITHSAKFCTERPRRRGAKLTGRQIEADEVIQQVDLDFEGKRDRWNGYDPVEYNKTAELFSKIDAERRKLKAKELNEQSLSNTLKPSSEDNSDGEDEDETGEFKDDDKAKDEESNVGGYFGARSRSTVRNLRIREDTAKYLYNLDANSAHYDAKTRSMRENPNANLNPDEVVYAGDNAVRYTGDWFDYMEMQKFTIDAYNKGLDVNLSAVPSQAELLFRKSKEKEVKQQSVHKKSILEKYGGEKYLKPPKELSLAQTEQYLEFTPDGRVVNHSKKVVSKSRYEEDVYINGHTSVWGSFWKDGKWGYACCQSLDFKKPCTISDIILPITDIPLNELKMSKVSKKQQQEQQQEQQQSSSSSSSSLKSSSSVSSNLQQKRKKESDSIEERNSVDNGDCNDKQKDDNSSQKDTTENNNNAKRRKL